MLLFDPASHTHQHISQRVCQSFFIFEDRSKFHNRARYRLAYSFLSRFVRTIEVMMDGSLALAPFLSPFLRGGIFSSQRDSYVHNSNNTNNTKPSA